ncbi:MAG: DMT family transporter [Bacteroidota bacterium]|nr:DMT family transporter [Bacteroidota bacterium]
MSSKIDPTPAQNSFLKIYKAEIILLLVTFTWGLTFPLIKISLQFISPVFFLFIRFFVTLIVFYFLFRKKLDFSKFTEWKSGLILGIFLFFGFALQTTGLKFTTASKSAFITGTALIIIPFAQYFILKNKPRPENIAGAFLVLTGLYILSEVYFTLPNAGDILTLFSAVSFAIHIVLLDKYSRSINFYYVAFGQFLAMTILSLVFMLIFEVFVFNELFIIINATLILSLIYTSLISTLLSIILITKYQYETTPLRAGIIYNMESLFAVFFAFILLGEILNFNQIIGAVIMISGLLISEFYGLIKFKK